MQVQKKHRRDKIPLWEVTDMNIQKFTQKSMEAVQDCEKLAYEYGNQEIEQEHLLLLFYNRKMV